MRLDGTFVALPHQYAVMRTLSPARGPMKIGTSLIGGLGSGKTRLGAEFAVRMAIWNRRFANRIEAPLIVGCPSYPQAHGSSFAAVVAKLRAMGLRPGDGLSPTDPTYASVWSGGANEVRFLGTKIAWVSAENARRVEGWTVAGLWVDEPDSCPRYAEPGVPLFSLWIARIRAAVDAAKGECLRFLFTGTPKGMARLYEAHHGAGSGSPPIDGILPWVQARTADNPYLPRGYEAELRRSMTPRLAKGLLDGEFVDLTEGQAYEAFERGKHVESVSYSGTRRTFLTCDFNRTPMSWLLCQELSPGHFGVIREFSIPETTTSAAAREVAAVLRSHGHKTGLELHGDPAGQHGSTRSLQSDYDQIVAALGAEFGPIQRAYRRAPTAVVARVGLVNTVLSRGGLTIDPSCTGLIRDLTQVRFKAGTTTLDQSQGLTHLSDALGYLLQNVAPEGASKIWTSFY